MTYQKFDYHMDFEKPERQDVDERKFTDLQLESVKEEFFKLGIEEGQRIHAEEVDSQLRLALGAFERRLSHFIEEQSNQQLKLRQDSIELARIVATKIAISEAEKNAVDRVVSCMEIATQTLLDNPTMIIKVHSDLRDPLREHLQEMGKAEVIKVESMDSLPLTDCQLSWGMGGADCSLQKTVKDIEDIINAAVKSTQEICRHDDYNRKGEKHVR